MDKTTVIVLVVIGILVIGIVMYSMSQQSAKDRELQLQIAQMQNQQGGGEANLWSSIGDWGSLIGSIGGLFGSKEA